MLLRSVQLYRAYLQQHLHLTVSGLEAPLCQQWTHHAEYSALILAPRQYSQLWYTTQWHNRPCRQQILSGNSTPAQSQYINADAAIVFHASACMTVIPKY